MSLFIRNDIRVRDLDKRYKKAMRALARQAAIKRYGPPSWNMAINIPIYQCAAQVEKLTVKGA